MFKNLRVKFKLMLFVELFAVVFLIFGWYTFDTIGLVKVNGEIYQDILKSKGLITDLSALAEKMDESYFLAQRLIESKNPAEIAVLIDKINALADGYQTRLQNRIQQAPTSKLHSLIEGPVNAEAVNFFQVLQTQVVPAIQKSDLAGARALLRESLSVEFKGHAQQIEKALELANKESLEKEQKARFIVDERRIILITLGVGSFLFALFFVAFPVARGITRPLAEIELAAKKIATGDLDCRIVHQSDDEFGSLAESFRRTITYIQEAAAVSDSLSRGDLTVSVAPRSEDDILGKSLKSMTHSLGSLIGKIKQSSIQLMSTATEIAATSKQQEGTVVDFGASTNQIASAVKEISATASELTKTMSDLAQVASHTGEMADSGRTNLTTLESTMSQLAEATGSISSKLYTISEKAHDINMVVTTITKVADQTNLLSVNAAIEAEKAGEYGGGFLVVAREIRRLADQTAVATLDIEQTVQQMQSAVTSGVMEMDRFSAQVRRDVGEMRSISAQFTQIIESVQAVLEQFRTVSEGMRSQSMGAQQISQAMIQLSVGARQTAASQKDFNKSTEHMHEAVKGLREELSRFHVAD
ncbi:MAG: methyl-accepting chemotaxis protein [Candidatus Lernaella stagnicola]|nr:methyl-accepting chemotaxis protein [Candidatus Lernaella stagnicola]